MKYCNYLISSLIYFLILDLNAQEVKTISKVIEIQKEQTFNLTTFNSRAYIPVSIPENTIAWYIAFSSSTDNDAVNPIGLFSQIASKLDPSGLTSLATSALTAPNGTSACDVLICQLENRRKFMNGDNDYRYYDNISRQNLTSGIIKIEKPFTGDLQVLLYNASFTTSINVKVEITAIVEEQNIDMTKWSNALKDTLFKAYYGDLKTENYTDNVSNDLANCVISKIIKQKTPEDMTKMSEFELDKLEKELKEQCVAQISGGVKTEEQEKGANYGTIGWKAYINGDIDKCIEYSKKAIGFDANLGWVKANLGLCYLIKNDQATATDFYMDAISANKKDKINVKRQFEAEIKDIDEAVIKYPTMKGYKELQDMLKTELSKY